MGDRSPSIFAQTPALRRIPPRRRIRRRLAVSGRRAAQNVRESANAATIGRTVFRASAAVRSEGDATGLRSAFMKSKGRRMLDVVADFAGGNAVFPGSEFVCGAAICRIACFGRAIDYSFR